MSNEILSSWGISAGSVFYLTVDFFQQIFFPFNEALNFGLELVLEGFRERQKKLGKRERKIEDVNDKK